MKVSIRANIEISINIYRAESVLPSTPRHPGSCRTKSFDVSNYQSRTYQRYRFSCGRLSASHQTRLSIPITAEVVCRTRTESPPVAPRHRHHFSVQQQTSSTRPRSLQRETKQNKTSLVETVAPGYTLTLSGHSTLYSLHTGRPSWHCLVEVYPRFKRLHLGNQSVALLTQHLDAILQQLLRREGREGRDGGGVHTKRAGKREAQRKKI